MSEQIYNTVAGMDVHKKSINVAVIPSGDHKVREEWQVENSPRALKKLAKRLKGISKAPVQAVYEAGP